MSQLKKSIGNPALIAATPIVKDVAPAVVDTAKQTAVTVVNKTRTTGRYILYAIGGVIVIVTMSKFIRYQRQQKYLKQAMHDPNVLAAVKIYDAIPAGSKKGSGSLFNPFGFIKDIGDKISLLWKDTDSQKILLVAEKNITDVNLTIKAFKAIYGEDLVELLKKVLTETEFDKFIKGINASKIVPNNLVQNVSDSGKYLINYRESIGFIVTNDAIKAVSSGAIAKMKNRIPKKTYVGISTGYEYTSPYFVGGKQTTFLIIKTELKNKANGKNIFIALPKDDLDVISEKKKNKYTKLSL